MSEALAVAVIGLGTIGRAVARHLLDAGFEVSVCDVREEALAPFAERGCLATTSPVEAAEGADVTFVVVVDDAQVRSVVCEPSGALGKSRPGACLVVLSTVSAATIDEIAARAAGCGVEVLDTGVSGGPNGAERGELVAMVGGPAEAVDRVRPALEAFCSLVVHMGGVGSGIRAKLARNLIQYSAWMAAYEGQLLAEAAGIDLSKLAQVIRHSDRQTGGITALMLRDTVEPLPPDTDPEWLSLMRSTAALAHKDLRAALDLAAELGLDLPVTRLADARYDRVLGLP